MAGPLNNAKLLPFGLYDQWVPAFAQLFEQAGQHWPAFYAHVELLAQQPLSQRQQTLKELLALGLARGAAELGCGLGHDY